MRELIKLLLVVGIVLGIFLFRDTTNDRDIVLKLYNNTFKLINSNGQSGGTGFFVKTKFGIYALTNEHVCGDDFVMRGVGNGFEDNFMVVRADYKSDLCLLTNPKFLHSTSYGIELADMVKEMERITSLGFSYLRAPNPRHGYIAGTGEETAGYAPFDGRCKDLEAPKIVEGMFGPMVVCTTTYDVFYTTIEAHPGNSGSPVVNDRGELVAVVNMLDTNTNYALLVPLLKVKLFLEGM